MTNFHDGFRSPTTTGIDVPLGDVVGFELLNAFPSGQSTFQSTDVNAEGFTHCGGALGKCAGVRWGPSGATASATSTASALCYGKNVNVEHAKKKYGEKGKESAAQKKRLTRAEGMVHCIIADP